MINWPQKRTQREPSTHRSVWTNRGGQLCSWHYPSEKASSDAVEFLKGLGYADARFEPIPRDATGRVVPFMAPA